MNLSVKFGDELSSAWSGVTRPRVSAITEHDCLECNEIRDFFGGKLWADFADVAALLYHCDALHLFAPSAYHYYLPAFIRATLLDPQTADRIPDTILNTIEVEFGNEARGRLELFSSPQRAVIARFLRALPALDIAEAEDVATLADLLDG
jgi:hypothetical protein